MELSNTATPKYYGAFREAVKNGLIPINSKVNMQMNRIDAMIADPNIYYCEDAVEHWINYCESELTLTDGSDFHMLDTFKLWGEDLLGWYYFTNRSVYEPNEDGYGGHYVNKKILNRLINKQFLIVGRGAAKSVYDSCIQSYFLNVDTHTTFQIAVAPTMNLAEEILGPMRTSIVRAKGPFFKFLTHGSLQNTTGNNMDKLMLTPTKKGIENRLTNSIVCIRPMAIDKLQGIRPKVSTIDEWLSGATREDVITAVEQGAAKEKDWILVATSSEGTVRNGPGDDIKMELDKILKGEYPNPHVSIWWYCLDDISEVGNPELWPKANPNLGATVSFDTYQREVEKAEQVPSARNDILAKRFGIPLEGFTYFFTYEETIPHGIQDFWGCPCALGGDLSQGNDFCSFSFLFPLNRGSTFGIKTRSYITSTTLMKLPQAMRKKYEEFIQEGSLIIMEGIVLEPLDIYDDLMAHIAERNYDVRCFGYDPYNAKEFVERYCSENSPFGVEKVIQGKRTESVPLGELKNLAEERQLIFDESIMSFAMGNAIAITDNNGNMMLSKKRYDAKIDPVSATMDAYIAYKLNTQSFE